MAAVKTNTSNFNFTENELYKLENALKQQEFRNLLSDYVKEISDPENRSRYEREFALLEQERGFEVTFLHPEPGFVIRGQTLDNGSTVFLNICTDPQVERSESVKSSGAQKPTWKIPYAQSPPRDDVDEDGDRCVVCDVVFHPNTLQLASRNGQMKNLVKATAIEAVESNLNVKLDGKTVKSPRMKFKGVFHPTVIRKPISQPAGPREPTYVMKFRSLDGDLEFARRDSRVKDPCRPAYIVVEISTPEMTGAQGMDLDVLEHQLVFECFEPVHYRLKLDLPYPVEEESGDAKFDKCTKKLVVTLPVQKEPITRLVSTDSGIEVDVGYRTSVDGDDVDDCVIDSAPYEEEESSPLSQKSSLLFPSFACKAFEEALIFTLDVKNVDPSSVHKEKLAPCGFALRFTSVGSGMVPFDYGFAFVLNGNKPGDDISLDDVQTEVWDNNLVIQLPTPADVSVEYEAGEDADHLKPQKLPNIQRLGEKKSPSEERPRKPKKPQPKSREDDAHHADNEEEVDDGIGEDSKDRHSSGESQDSAFASSPLDHTNYEVYFAEEATRRSVRSILKRRTRFYSDSQADQYSLSIDECHSLETFPEEEGCFSESGDEVTGSSKKSVRFNEVVQRQIYRSGSSILGQRTKNQKKAEQKKRRQAERRASESDVSSYATTDVGCGDGKSVQADEEDSGCASANEGEAKTRKAKRKNRKGKFSAAEAAANDLIFDLDI